jgi:hypothetical protein
VPFLQVSQNVQFKDITQRIVGFGAYLQTQIASATQSLVRGGVTEARKKIRSSTTPWGNARMQGSYGGVQFKSFGRTSGREETGFMYDSISSSIKANKYGNKGIMGTMGWTTDALDRAPYIPFQEQGFYSTGTFDKQATQASGIAKFKSGPTKYIEGARSIPFARDRMIRRAPSLYSRALNLAIKKFKSDGFRGDPKRYAQLDIPKQNKYDIAQSGLFVSSPLLKTRFF